MTSDKTPLIIHDSIVDHLSDMDGRWRDKNVNEYSPEHLVDVLNDELDRELENEQKNGQTVKTEDASDTEDADEPEREGLSGEELDVFARVLSKILKGDYVSEEIETHLGDAITQIDNDWRNAVNDYNSEDYIGKVMRGYLGEDESA